MPSRLDAILKRQKLEREHKKKYLEEKASNPNLNKIELAALLKQEMIEYVQQIMDPSTSDQERYRINDKYNEKLKLFRQLKTK